MYKSKIKIILMLMIILLTLLIFSSIVNAVDTDTTYTATSSINGVTVNWSYKLNELNKIVDLKCTNPSDIIGDIIIPSTLDDKTVVALGYQAFESATGLTGVTIPSTVTEIEYRAFQNCSELINVDLGSVQSISFDVFKNCPKLTNITIPKTLINGTTSSGGVFTGTTNLTSVIFEDGITEIPAGILHECSEIASVTIPDSVTKINCYAFGDTGISEIIIPNSVAEISYKAFENCYNLTNVDLGNVQSISFDVFKNCPKLTSIIIPKTLIKGTSVGAVFTGTTNLASVIFEDGITEIPAGILQNCIGITSVTIPNSVTKINCYAFAGTGISEITIPNSVAEIEYYAFKDCEQLKKITILDSVTKMGWFTLYPTEDTVFTNHSDDLTIYCYEGTTVAQYAINNNIKYVYLTKTSTGNGTNTDNQGTVQEENAGDITQNLSTDKVDPTIAPVSLPNAGIGIGIILSVIVLLIGGLFNYFKYRNLRGI